MKWDNECASGPAVCRRGERCQVAVLVYENATQAILVEQPGTHLVELVANEEECYVDVALLAVGGGGRYVFYGGGGGSGYVSKTEARLTVGASIEVGVGGEGHQSEVVAASESGWETLLVADPGGEETSWKGGDGFSGGGGNGEGQGGSGGENGENGRFTSGGSGSGLQVELLSTASFALSAGAGGVSTWEHTGGGGGGGVLVNGRGPEGASQYCGQVNNDRKEDKISWFLSRAMVVAPGQETVVCRVLCFWKSMNCDFCRCYHFENAGRGDTYGSVSAGRGKWPFRVLFFLKVERSCGFT